MGNIRTPKPEYFKQGVVEFFVKKKQIYYQTTLWNKTGFNQRVFESCLFNEPVIDIINRGLHSFSSVGVIEN